MNGVRITEKGVVSSLSSTDYILIVTPITENGVTTNDVRRVTVAQFMEEMSVNGVVSIEAGTVEGESGLIVTYSDNSTDFIQVASGSGGLGIDDWGTTYDAENNVYQLHLYDADGNDLLEPLTMPATGGGSTADSTIKIINRMASRSVTFLDTDDGYIEYSVTSLSNEDQQPTGPVRTTWFVDNMQVWSETVSQGNNRFLVKPYLTAGTTSTVRLVVEDNLGTSKPAVWTATLTSFGLKWNIASDMANYGTNSLLVRMTPSGSGSNRIIHLKVDDGEEQTFDIGSSSRTVETTIPAQSHGAHTIEAWMTATVDGSPVETEHLVHVGIWTRPNSQNAIVGMKIETNPVNQYDNAVVKFMAYVPGSETAEVTLAAGGNLVNEITVDRSMQTWSYPANAAGNILLRVTCNGVSAQDTLVVNEADIQIDPVTVGLVLDLDPTGHSNSEANPELWGYKDANGEMHKLSYVGGAGAFDWVNGGFQTDENGSTAFVVRRGNYVTVPYTLFGDECENSDGKNLKLIYKAVNVRTKNTQIASCLGENGAGVVLRSHSATLTSRTESLSVPYRDENVIEMDINIQPKSQDSLAIIHLKAIPSAVVQYGNDDTWRAANAMLTIGSDDCDVWIYRMKLYSANQSDANILDNYIADCVNAAEKRERASRNNVYSQGTTQINLTALAQRNRELRVIRISAAKMTTSKSDEVLCDVEIVYAAGGEEHHLIAKNVTMKAQGTSSLEYILAALNLDLDFSTCTSWVDGNGTAMTKYAMTENSIPVDYFNLKADVASSENANNVVLVDEYNKWNPCKAPGYAQDNRIRDSVEGHPCVVYFTNTGEAATQIGSRMIEPGETALYFVGNMNNSKKNFKVFGQNPDYDPQGLQCCVEITNNNNDEVVFRKNIGNDELFDGDGNFEFRYPKNPTQAMIDAFKEMHAWVVSTAADLATGANITGTSFDRDPSGTIYYKDSAAYRAAKWDYQVEDYFNTDSLCFHKLFVNHFLLVDNNAKNLFMSYEWDEDKQKYVWNVRCAYDMDTAMGTDNSGYLTFHYGMEDTDQTSQNAYVFNANRSTLWNNTRDRLADKMTAMYISLKNRGAWSASRLIARFKAHQSARPEVLIMEDMYNKYIVPKTAQGSSRFLDMMQGTKEDQRDEFLTYQEIYSNTRYCDTDDRSDVISLRGHTTAAVQGNLAITMFARCYAVVKYGNAGTVRVRVTEDGGTAQIACPASVMDDLEVYCFGAQNIVSIGDFSQMRTGSIEMSTAKKLQYLYAGSGESGYENGRLTGLSLGATPMLEVVDLRGLVALTGSLSLTNLVSLKTLHATNTGITGVVFADNAPLENAYLPEIKSITAKNLSKVETFSLSPTAIQDITVENSVGIDTAGIVTDAAKILSARLVGVNWTFANADAVLRLMEAEGKDALGNTIPLAVVTGSAYFNVIGQSELQRLNAAFPDLDITYGSLVSEHTVTFKGEDGTTLCTETVRHGETAPDPIATGVIERPTKAPDTSYVYYFGGWDTSLENITANITVRPTFTAGARQYTVTWYEGLNIGTTVAYQTTVAAGENAAYGGNDITAPTGYQWGGWQQSTKNVTSDLNVFPWFIRPQEPSAYPTGHDYVYSDDPADDSAYTFEELWYLCTVNDTTTGKPLIRSAVEKGGRIKIVPDTTVFADDSIVCQLEAYQHFRTADGNGWTNSFWGMVGVMNANHRMGADNKGGWPASEMRLWLNNTIFPALPRHWRCVITQAQVLSSAGNTATNIVSSSDYLFLRSQEEVLWSTGTPYDGEIADGADEKQLSLYNAQTARVKKLYNGTGSAQIWWLRSPYPSNSTNYHIVNTSCTGNTTIAGSAYYVSFGFCIGTLTE